MFDELSLAGERLVVLDTASRTVTTRVPVGRRAGILITPDGSRACLALTGDNDVAVIHLKTLAEAGRPKTGSSRDEMTLLPARREETRRTAGDLTSSPNPGDSG